MVSKSGAEVNEILPYVSISRFSPVIEYVKPFTLPQLIPSGAGIVPPLSASVTAMQPTAVSPSFTEKLADEVITGVSSFKFTSVT